jgi:nucleoside-diphosphate-sugar epimerase
VLGSRLVSNQAAQGAGRGYIVRIMSRSPAPVKLAAGLEWAQADLKTGQGLPAALAGVETIVHAATDPLKHARAVDVAGTGRLVAEARAAGVAHLVYISIVGIDRLQAPAGLRLLSRQAGG